MDREGRARIRIAGDGAYAEAWAAALRRRAIVASSAEDLPGCDGLVVCGGEDAFARTRDALASGCDVLFGAPMSLSPKQLSVLSASARKSGALLRFVEHFRYRPGFGFLQRLTRGNDALWRLRYLRMLRLEPATAGLRMDSLMIEQFALCDGLLGRAPARISASAVEQDKRGDAIAIFLAMAYRDGTLAQVTVSRAEALEACQLVAVTDERTIVLDDLDPVAALRVFGGRQTDEERLLGQRSPDAQRMIATREDLIERETSRFIGALSGGTAMKSNAERWRRSAEHWYAIRDALAHHGHAGVRLPETGGLRRKPSLRLIDGGAPGTRAPQVRPPLAVVAS
jgi:predicted dehydrogenase